MKKDKKCSVCFKDYKVNLCRDKKSKYCSNKCRLIALHNKLKIEKRCFYNNNFQKEMNKRANKNGLPGKKSQKILKEKQIGAFYDKNIQILNGKKAAITNKKNKTCCYFDGKQHERMIKLWKTDEYRIKIIPAILNGLLKKPTSFEQKIILLCSKHHLPFIYTGDGRILIGYKNPDFIYKEKKIIIEVFLNYFKIRDYGSIDNYIKRRGEHFAKFGYKTIFIREEEITNKNWEKICLNKIHNNLR